MSKLLIGKYDSPWTKNVPLENLVVDIRPAQWYI